MGVLGVLTCEILELEFAELLATDRDVGRISVLEDERSAHLIEALESINREYKDIAFVVSESVEDRAESRIEEGERLRRNLYVYSMV